MFISASGNAQEQFRHNAEAETLFSRGLEMYHAGSFENAAELFETALNINPIHQRTTASYLMGAKSWLSIREEAQAMFLLNNFLKRFPQSEYAREAHFTLGTTYFLLQEYTSSVKEFLNVLQPGVRDERTIKSELILDSLVRFVLSPSETKELSDETQNDFLKELIARNETALSSDPESSPPPVPKRRKTKTIGIGALLPLMSASSGSSIKKAAEEVIEGMTIAQAQFEETDTEIEIVLDVKNTELDSFLAKNIVKEFSSDNNTVALIGPLFSNMVQACVPEASAGKIPLVAPIANTVGLAGMSEYIFQANADLAMHGKALAHYAVKQLAMTSLGVIAPNNPTANTLTSAFIAEAKRLGANVTAHETYEKISDDLSQKFLALRKSNVRSEPQVSFEKKISGSLRKRIIKAGASATLVDSLIASRGRVPVSRLFETNGLKTARALNLTIINPRSTASNMELPISTIQGVFAPVASSDDIGVIASQMMYYNIKAQLLGSAEWYDESQLEIQRRYAEGVIFCSDYFMNENDPAFISLQQQLRKKPTKYTLFGYDTMNLILSCIERGSITRESLRDCLSNIQFWEGAHSTVTLSKGRVNRVVQILQFDEGVVQRVTEVTVE